MAVMAVMAVMAAVVYALACIGTLQVSGWMADAKRRRTGGSDDD